ncbi:UDP-3-O-acyl-N-acetylglucosamine deacetylase [Elioraea sp. Yellowstone]|uniref:UDP-3-O-acyl-N-acetylglucosamine deacetylase n=1 Tax=Elioraea sp. Yellowstone TaxID=2592070 RepID=UPI001EFF9014|nr:UDP-3-O-acyl-N-acetylglucosamine deacetylase [Elioraea sp. Yellowstone]
MQITPQDWMTEASLPVQRTLRAPIGCTGVGLHSGRKVALTLRPAAENSGIVVVRTDLPGGPVAIPARWDHVVDTRRCTVLGHAGRPETHVGTVEHLLAALAGSGIDNAVIEVDGPEIPVMDGSAAPFVFLIECAGVAVQEAPRRVIEILRPVRVEEGDAAIALLPDPSPWLGLEMEIEFASAAIRRQSRSVRLAPGVFKAELARARTFGFVEEIEALREAGLARGGSLANAVVLRGATVLNAGGLRYADEFVRHKLLDAVGDLALAGHRLRGKVVARRAGHRLNNRLLQALFTDPGSHRIVDALPSASVRDGASAPLAAAAAAPV